MNIDIPLFLDAKIFSSNNNLSSLSSINENDSYIDNSYLQLLQDNGTTQNDLKICLKKYSLNNILRLQFLQNENNNNETKHSCGCSIDNLNCRDKESDIFSNVISPRDTKNVSENNLTKTTFSEWLDLISENKEESTCFAPKKWRTVEENTLLILNSNGFNLKDVSKQNVGYDLEGNDPKGNIIYIEVKSLEYYGQKFRMTNNEFAVAQYKPNNYYLALVVLSASSIEISLIKDPINKLKLNRQCVQWVWECSEYKCTPFKFTFD